MTNKYAEFFFESAEGQAYIHTLEEMIAQKHYKSEQDGDLSRDFSKEARGIREALNLVKSLSTGSKQPYKEDADT